MSAELWRCADTQYIGWLTKVQVHSGRGVCEAPTGSNQSLPWWLRISRGSVSLRHKVPCYEFNSGSPGGALGPGWSKTNLQPLAGVTPDLYLISNLLTYYFKLYIPPQVHRQNSEIYNSQFWHLLTPSALFWRILMSKSFSWLKITKICSCL